MCIYIYVHVCFQWLVRIRAAGISLRQDPLQSRNRVALRLVLEAATASRQLYWKAICSGSINRVKRAVQRTGLVYKCETLLRRICYGTLPVERRQSVLPMTSVTWTDYFRWGLIVATRRQACARSKPVSWPQPHQNEMYRKASRISGFPLYGSGSFGGPDASFAEFAASSWSPRSIQRQDAATRLPPSPFGLVPDWLEICRR